MHTLRDELDLRRRRLLNELDELFDRWLTRRVRASDREELVDEIERRLEASDLQLMKEAMK